jgi:chemotaxis regulatin CheY-phosphate phosphatase CheZ
VLNACRDMQIAKIIEQNQARPQEVLNSLGEMNAGLQNRYQYVKTEQAKEAFGAAYPDLYIRLSFVIQGTSNVLEKP